MTILINNDVHWSYCSTLVHMIVSKIIARRGVRSQSSKFCAYPAQFPQTLLRLALVFVLCLKPDLTLALKRTHPPPPPAPSHDCSRLVTGTPRWCEPWQVLGGKAREEACFWLLNPLCPELSFYTGAGSVAQCVKLPHAASASRIRVPGLRPSYWISSLLPAHGLESSR